MNHSAHTDNKQKNLKKKKPNKLLLSITNPKTEIRAKYFESKTFNLGAGIQKSTNFTLVIFSAKTNATTVANTKPFDVIIVIIGNLKLI